MGMLHTHIHAHTHTYIYTYKHHFLNTTNNSMHYLQRISGDEEMVDWGFHFHLGMVASSLMLSQSILLIMAFYNYYQHSTAILILWNETAVSRHGC